MGFMKDPKLVLEFYNERRQKLADVEPNQGHKDLVTLEDYFNVHIITQNIDDLHERAGSSNICYIHGELTKAKTNMSPDNVTDIGYEDINIGDMGEDGSQLRPDVVWFGESVTKLPEAERIARSADIFMIVGTSLAVFPAAGLVTLTRKDVPVYIIDPVKPDYIVAYKERITHIQEPATVGVAKVAGDLIEMALE